LANKLYIFLFLIISAPLFAQLDEESIMEKFSPPGSKTLTSLKKVPKKTADIYKLKLIMNL
jgi:hypothetical protein